MADPADSHCRRRPQRARTATTTSTVDPDTPALERRRADHRRAGDPGRIARRVLRRLGPADPQRRERRAAGARRAHRHRHLLPDRAVPFLSAGNLVNLFVQAALFIMFGAAEIFVLLLSEIDLSVGYVAGCRRVRHRRADRRRRSTSRGGWASSAVCVVCAVHRLPSGHAHHPARAAVVHRHAGRPPRVRRRDARARQHRQDGRRRRDVDRLRTAPSTSSSTRT